MNYFIGLRNWGSMDQYKKSIIEWKKYVVSILIIIVAALLRLWPLQSLELRTVWVTFYPAVMLTAIYGGFYSGFLATMVSCFIALFLWPIFVEKPFINDFGDWLSLFVFVFTCTLVSGVAETMLRTRKKLKQINLKLETANSDLEREILGRREAENELLASKNQLETAVNERTAQLKDANEILAKNEKRYRNTLDSMLEGCQIIGFDWKYIYLNDAAERHNRRPKGDLLNRKYADMWPGIENTVVYAVIKHCLEDRIIQHMENEFIFPDGTRGWFELSILPSPEGIIILSNDVTERKEAEDEIRNLNTELEKRVIERTIQLEAANKELESFSYSVSHDLRAPLRHIGGFLELLNKTKNSLWDEKSSRYLNIILDSAKQMGILIDDLLNFSHMGRAALKYKLVDFNELITAVIKEIEDCMGKGRIEWQLAQLPSIPADPSLMKIVFVNLLNNAVKYSAKTELPQIKIGFNNTIDSKIIFFVKDNGTGFDMKYAHKLFGVFQRLHSSEEYEGTGIGLATVKRIIQKHNGETWAEGEIGKGASFYFSLPVTIKNPDSSIFYDEVN